MINGGDPGGGYLRSLFEGGKKLYMAHLYFGDPSREFSFDLIRSMVSSGVDIVEFGIPFSDPIADGPVFQRACQRALWGGCTPKACIEALFRLRKEGVKAPVVVTTYYNIIENMGAERFFESMRSAGVGGVIIPDAPYEETERHLSPARDRGVALIPVVTPLTSEKRLKKVLSGGEGFVYGVSVPGVTGERRDIKAETLQFVSRVKRISHLPLMVGFGISRPEQVKEVISAGADGVITGSALCSIYEKELSNPWKALPEIEDFCRRIKEAALVRGRENSKGNFSDGSYRVGFGNDDQE